MNSKELMKAAMRRKPTERIPTMPAIYFDLPLRIEAAEKGTDWIDSLIRCSANPQLVYDYMIDIVNRTGCDGLRMFVAGDPRAVIREGERLIVIDPKTQKRLGKLDVEGGGAFISDNSPPVVETLEEAKVRIEAMLNSLTDEKLEMLKVNRVRVPDLFVASQPLCITLNTYNVLRGREQAMIDLFERPDFVSAVLDMQAEASILFSEKLLKTGIDAFYIGDASSSASLINPKHFEQFCLPAFQKFCRHFRNTDILIYIHICGNSKPILEMMADTGAHVIDPLDPLGGVDVADAKARVGHRVALMGGVNTLTLADGTAEQVRAEAITKCREGGPFGYILAAGDMVPPVTPLENLQALVDVARKSLWK